MKKLNVLLVVLLLACFAVFALGSGEEGTKDQGGGSAVNQGEGSAENGGSNVSGNDRLGDFSIVIDSCRLAEDYEGKPVVIVKYIFSNVESEDAKSFMTAFDDEVYQNGVSLNSAIIIDDSIHYSSDNQMKDIKKGASLEVEVAYELNDTTTDIEVEVSELFSLDDVTITKTFTIA